MGRRRIIIIIIIIIFFFFLFKEKKSSTVIKAQSWCYFILTLYNKRIQVKEST